MPRANSLGFLHEPTVSFPVPLPASSPARVILLREQCLCLSMIALLFVVATGVIVLFSIEVF